MEPSRDSAMWLMFISSGTANANCMRGVGCGRRATNHVAAATATRASAAASQGITETRRVAAAAARTAVLPSVPDSAPNAKDRSRADWKRCSGFFSRQRSTTRSKSRDSREFGPVNQSLIYGKAVFGYWPMDKLGRVR